MTNLGLQIDRRVTRFVAALCFVGAALSGACQAADDAAGETETPLAYRRVLVPADKPQSWPRDDDKFLPVETNDFDTYVSAANAPSPTAQISAAEYHARFDGQRLVDGHAEWSIELRGSEPAFLPLADMSIVLRRARWRGEAESSAQVGWRPAGAGKPASFGLLVPKSGTVELEWHTMPGSSAGGAREMPLRFPAAARSRFTVDTPVGTKPTLGGGVLIENNAADGGCSWTFAMGDSRGAKLRFETAPNQSATSTTTATFRDELRYHVSERGLDLDTTLHVDANGSELRELSVRLPAGMQLVSAMSDGKPLAWHTAVGADKETMLATIELAESPRNGELTLTLQAWSAPDFDRMWRLPKLHIENAFWTNGTIELSLDGSLEMRELAPADCVEIAVHEQESATSDSQSLVFSSYSPDASVGLVVDHRAPVGRLQLGTTLQVGNPSVEGRMVGELGMDSGNLHALSAELQPGWAIDAVETIPADALGGWFVEPQDGVPTLHIQLERAASPDQPITFVVAGRLRRTDPLEPLVRDTLGMLTWRGMAVERNLVRLRAVEPFELEPIGELPAVRGEDITDDDRRRFDSAAEGKWFDLAAAAPTAAVRLTPKRGTFDVDIQADATLSGGQLKQSYLVVCRPRGSGVDQLLVYQSAPFLEQPTWIDAKTHEPLIAERMPSNDPRLGSLPAGGELWTIRLGRTYARPISLSATFVAPWPERGQVPLISLPDADSQQARVAVRSTDPGLPWIDARRLTSAPMPESAGNGQDSAAADTIATFRYQPTRFYDADPAPELWVGPPTSRTGDTQLLATSVRLESSFAANGSGSHRVVYQLENHGAVDVRLKLPAAMRLLAAMLDGHSVTVSRLPVSPELVTIPLPPGWRAGALELNLANEGLLPLGSSLLVPPLPTGSVTILGGTWTVWLPSELVATGEQVVPEMNQLDWRRRLFGPMAHVSGEPFNPFRAEDWSPIFQSDHMPQAEAATLSTEEHGSAGAQPRTNISADRLATSKSETEGPDGWHAFQVTFVAAPPDAITIIRPSAGVAWSLSLFLVCLAGGSWLPWRGAIWAILVAAAAVLSLLLPATFAPLATAALWGLICAPVSRWIWENFATNPSRATGNQGSRRTATAIALILIAVLVLVENSHAEAPKHDVTSEIRLNDEESPTRSDELAVPAQASANARPAVIERVLIPVGDDGHPAGSKYFVSERFLRELLEMSGEHGRANCDWLLEDMQCNGEFATQAGQPHLHAGTWTLSMDIEVLAQDAVIELPFEERDANWPATASLDGIPAPIVWGANGRGCSIHAREPGRCRMSIAFEPRVREVSNRHQIDLHVPPLAGAALRLTSPVQPAGLAVTGAGNLTHRGERAATVSSGEMDGSGRLVVSWADGVTGVSADPNRRVDELQWLQFKPDRVELSVKYVLRGKSDWPDTLMLATDDQWTLDPQAGDAASAETKTLPDGRQSIQIRVHHGSQNSDERRELQLSFRLRDAVALGRLRAPEMELTSLPIEGRMLAVSWDSSLECDPPAGMAAAARSVGDFVAAWGAGEADLPPQFVLGPTEHGADRTISVRPRASESPCDERLWIAAGADRLRLQYQADVQPRGAGRFGWSLEAPADFAIEQVSVEQSDGLIPVHWFRVAPDRVNVFYGAEATAPYRLRVIGRMPVPSSGELPLPRITRAGSGRAVQVVALYRGADVLASLALPASAARPREQVADAPPPEWPAHFVDAYALDNTVADATRISIEPNSTELSGQTLTTLLRENGVWSAKVVGQLKVDRGELEVLRMRVPPNWIGPYDVKPAANAELVADAAGDGAAILAIRLPQSVRKGETFKIEIRGPLTPANSPQVAVPSIAFQPGVNCRQFVCVPTTVDGTRATWNPLGVESAEIPAELQIVSGHAGNEQAFRVVSSPMSLSLRPRAAASATATVRLADTSIAINPAGGEYSVTRFVIVSQGLGQAIVELPRGERLVRAMLDGHPALVDSLDGGRWQVQLGPPNLPQTLEIVAFDTHHVETRDGSLTLRRPTLKQLDQSIPVEMCLWSLNRIDVQAKRRVVGGTLIEPKEVAALRLDRLASISEAAMPAVMESSVADGYHWFENWTRELHAAERAAYGLLASGADARTKPTVVHATEDLLTPATARCEAWIQQVEEIFAGPELASYRAASSEGSERDPWQLASRAASGWTCIVSDGATEQLSVQVVPAVSSGLQSRLLALACVVALAAAAVWTIRNPTVPEQAGSSPYLIGVAVGLIVWAWMRLSALGLVFATVCAVLWLRDQWLRRKHRPEGATSVTVPMS